MTRSRRAGKAGWWLVGGLLLVVLLVPLAVWFVAFRTKPTATAWLQVTMREDGLVSPAESAVGIEREFEIYKGTQRELLKNPYVLVAALRKPEVNQLPIVQRARPDEIAWLQDHLEASYPGDAEVMRVDLVGGDAKEAVILLNAVVGAYLDVVMQKEQSERRSKYDQVCQVYRAKEEEMRKKHAALFAVAGQLGIPDAETLALRQKLDLEALSAQRQELLEARSYLWQLKSELAGQEAMLKSVESIGFDDPEVQEAIDNDPTVRQLVDRPAVFKQSATSDQTEKQIREAQADLDARRGALLAIVRNKKQSPIEAQIQRLKATLDVAARRQEELEKEVEEKQKEVRKLGTSSVDVEMMRAEIKNSEAMMARLAMEKEDRQAELRMPPRLILLQPPEVPDP